jgi:hypothetical protein
LTSCKPASFARMTLLHGVSSKQAKHAWHCTRTNTFNCTLPKIFLLVSEDWSLQGYYTVSIGKFTDVSKYRSAFIFRVKQSKKIGMLGHDDVLRNHLFIQSTWRNMPKGLNLQQHRCEHLTSHVFVLFLLPLPPLLTHDGSDTPKKRIISLPCAEWHYNLDFPVSLTYCASPSTHCS